jgi:hypothetical protein
LKKPVSEGKQPDGKRTGELNKRDQGSVKGEEEEETRKRRN